MHFDYIKKDINFSKLFFFLRVNVSKSIQLYIIVNFENNNHTFETKLYNKKEK